MTIIPTTFKDLFLLKPDIFEDTRGSFSKHFSGKLFKNITEKDIYFYQDNLTHSKKGVLRGLHYQLPPFSQSKLVSVIQGKVFDVVVDIRKGSPSFGEHFTQELSDQNKLQLFIPRGFAHGFITLSENSIFMYKVDNYYEPQSEGSIAPDDPDLGINWNLPKSEWILSEKDRKNPRLSKARLFDYNKDMYA